MAQDLTRESEGSRDQAVEIPEHVLEFMTWEQAQASLGTAVRLRTQAMKLYRRRMDYMRALAGQLEGGVWRSAAAVEAVTAARRDHALLWRQREDFIAASGGGHDLDIAYHFRAPRAAELLTEDDFACALGFLGPFLADKVTLPDPASEPLWTAALRLEAQAYLAGLWGDWYLQRGLATLDMAVSQVLAATQGRDSHDPCVIRAHVVAIGLYHYYGLPAQVVTAFDRFRAAYTGGDPRYPWGERLATDPIFRRDSAMSFYFLMQMVLPAMALRNPSDRSEIEYLEAVRIILKPPLPRLPDPPIVTIPSMSAADLARTDDALARIAAALAEPAGRPAQVLKTWQAHARAGAYRFLDVLEALRGVTPDDEALGTVAHALAGEARYRLADYEDAHQSLSRAGELADAILARSPGLQFPLIASRDFAARLAQKAGNALYFMGDEGAAKEAYESARRLSSDDPLAEAVHLINLGNLAYLRDNLLDQRGYVTLDSELRYKLAMEGPTALQATKIAGHIAGLTEAERCYRYALERLSALAADEPLVRELTATAHVNLGNTAWAWARAMEAEGVERLDELPLGEGWQSALVAQSATLADCYRAAVAHQQQALAAGPADDPALQATVWSNLSELYYLLHEQTGNQFRLDEGVAAGQRVTTLTGEHGATDTAESPARLTALHPELAWRTRYNLARLHEALGEEEAARSCYEKAVEDIESMRAMIRLDTWQATFLQDKLEVYEGYIRFLYRRDAEGNREKIFELFERTKARAFLDLLESARIDLGLPPELVAARDDLLARIAACNEDIRRAIAEDNQARSVALRQQQQVYTDEWEQLQSRIAAAQQGDQDLNPRLVTLSELQAFLRRAAAPGADGAVPDTVVLSFLVGQRSSYLMVVDASTARIFELPGRRATELAVLPLIYYCANSSAETAVEFRAANVRAVDVLLGPADAALDLPRFLAGKKVVIIPDGVLFYLPFEILMVDRSHETQLDAAARYIAFRPYYLIARSDVSYMPSASAWLRLAACPPQAATTSILGVYNVNYDVGEPSRPLWALEVLLKLPNLPDNENVSRILSEFQERWPDQHTVHLRAWAADQTPEVAELQSTEDNFLRQVTATEPRYVLFSGHALYNDKVPSLSGLVFNLAPVSSAGGTAAGSLGCQDGFLRLEEVFWLKMPRTELTFLAACQTGLGMVYRGEGLNALTRAFMYQGSPSVVASLWAVSDNATRYLTRRFFHLVLEQPEADRGHLLAEAKRQVLENDRYSLPWFWAPFVLTGLRSPRSHGRPRQETVSTNSP